MTEMTAIPNNAFDALETLRNTYIRTPRDDLFRAHLDRLLKRDADGNLTPVPVTFTATGETRGIALVEGPGGGKTSLIDHVLSNHPALQSDDPTRRPVLSVRVPSPATVKSIGFEILRQSGYPATSSAKKEWQIWTDVRHRLKEFETAVLWLDEAHDLFRAGRAAEDILKLLKSLMQGDSAVIVILSGVDTLWEIASYDDQVKRRYSKMALPAMSSAKDGAALTEVIQKFSARVGLDPVIDDDLVDRLIHASRNRFGLCIENIIAAIETAVLKGSSRLEILHFAEAWGMQEGCDLGQNVFVSPRWAQIDLDEVKPKDAPAAQRARKPLTARMSRPAKAG
ncbi:MAG: TniB family NTP-binding protein [Rhodobacteraceae bacterium]|nr:TniB family NTP-binding protein [Paracoccaceae bacterium]